MESLTFFGVSVEYFGVFKGLLDLLVLISFRSYGGILTWGVIGCCEHLNSTRSG
jgi:hypothetical protein